MYLKSLTLGRTNFKLHACVWFFKATKNRFSFGVELYLYIDLFPDLFTENTRTGVLKLDVIAVFSFVASPLLSVFVLYTLLSCPLFSPCVLLLYRTETEENTLSNFGACRRLIVDDESWKTSKNSSGCLDVCNDYELRINC